MSAKVRSRGPGLLALAAVALNLVIVMLVALRPAGDGEELERGPAREAVALERAVDPREMPAPRIPASPERAPAEPSERAESSTPEELVIGWEPGALDLDTTVVLDDAFIFQLLDEAIAPELTGDSVLAGVFTGWAEGDRGRQVALQLVAGPARRTVTVPVDEPFRIEELPAGRYRLAATLNDEPHWCGELSDVELPAAAEVGGLVIVLGSPIELRGTVSDEHGSPVVGAQVQLVAEGGELSRTVATDETGSYAVVGGMAGPYRVSASHDDYLDVSSDAFALRASEVRVMHLTLERGLTLVGRVSDPAGTPLQGVDVFLRSRTQSMNLETDADGRFALSPVRADEIRIYARAGGPSGQANSARCVVQVTRGVDPPEVQLTLRPSCEIHGLLVDADGAALAGVEVVARAVDNAHVTREGTSGLDGTFRIPGLYEGTYELLVAGNLRDGPQATVAAGLGAPSVVVEFEPLPHHPFAPQ